MGFKVRLTCQKSRNGRIARCPGGSETSRKIGVSSLTAAEPGGCENARSVQKALGTSGFRIDRKSLPGDCADAGRVSVARDRVRVAPFRRNLRPLAAADKP